MSRRAVSRPVGRPPRSEAPTSRDAIVEAALALLDARGVDAFAMRALAERLGVTPMAIYHHFNDRDGLIAAMTERVYGGVAAPAGGAPCARIEGLLRRYHRQVLKHPGLTLLIFSRPSVFPDQARRITGDIARLLAEAGLAPDRVRLWIDILVDFTHGAAIAVAMGGGADADADAYDAALGELLAGLSS